MLEGWRARSRRAARRVGEVPRVERPVATVTRARDPSVRLRQSADPLHRCVADKRPPPATQGLPAIRAVRSRRSGGRASAQEHPGSA